MTKIIQCDGASEFIGKNTDLGRYCAKKGIEIRKFSPSYPEENSVAEKTNETCWNCAQAICLTAQLPPNFWKFAERMASKVILMVIKQRQEISLYEKLYGVKPSMDLICVFGCHAFAHVSVDS